MIADGVLTIQVREDLGYLNLYRRAGRRVGFRKIKLAVPQLPTAEAATREARLNRLFFDCGCGEATAFGLAALAALAGWITLRAEGWASIGWIDLAYAAGGFFLAAGLGKAIGRLRARRALRREIASLAPQLKEEPHPEGFEPARCGVR